MIPPNNGYDRVDLDVIDDPYRTCYWCDQRCHEELGHSCYACDEWICTVCWEEGHRHLTVREWFRGMRANPQLYQDLFDIDRLVTKVLAGQPIDLVETIGACKLIFNREEWERCGNLETRVKMQLEIALAELEREAARRALIEASGISR